ncbi:MFS transporter [Falsiroseomonas sp.]|uniref:MFS transporter n=1 Tax=Falsiroseomonas sp. TaxID=2870721 RepID=UPI00272881B0|nr:MFS transporter [Falsiroseomonas sp.]MDO9498651.1 MFS transporter [Falsiroseomonas sp.]
MKLPAALTPLRHPAFRLLWLANLCSNTGMWMQNTGAGWLMTSLAPSPLMVSLVQVASLLPVFLLALPAGALADIVDRRRYLILAQAWIAASGALLAVLAWTDSLGAWGLVGLTFCIGIGTAMNSPAWAATTPETVPRQDLTGAIVLNGIGFNLSRTVGPAIGGFTVAAAGAEATFALNALSFLAVIVALLFWKREAPRATLPKEHFLSAIRAGLGYTRASPVLRGVMLRGFVFFLFAAALWGLLPLLVRQQLGLGPQWFGIMLAAMGVGAVGAGLLLPSLRGRLDRSGTVTLAAVITGTALVLLGQAQHWAVALLAMLLYGIGWLAGASTLQACAQLSVPGWVRARAIGIYQLVTFGGLTLGAGFGGYGGEALGIGTALGLSGVLCAVGGLLVRRYAIEPPAAETAAETGVEAGTQMPDAPRPAVPKPEPAAPSLARLLNDESGRVLEVVRYEIAPQDRAAFLIAMAACRQVRLRSGAQGWRLYEDVAHPERWVELWLMDSWTEHLREEGRMTEWDRSVLARAAALHAGPAGPEASRYLNVMPGLLS